MPVSECRWSKWRRRTCVCRERTASCDGRWRAVAQRLSSQVAHSTSHSSERWRTGSSDASSSLSAACSPSTTRRTGTDTGLRSDTLALCSLTHYNLISTLRPHPHPSTLPPLSDNQTSSHFDNSLRLALWCSCIVEDWQTGKCAIWLNVRLYLIRFPAGAYFFVLPVLYSIFFPLCRHNANDTALLI